MTLLAPVDGASIPGGQPYDYQVPHRRSGNGSLRVVGHLLGRQRRDVDLYLAATPASHRTPASRHRGTMPAPGRIPVRPGQPWSGSSHGPTTTRRLGTPSTANVTITAQPGEVPYPWQQTDIGAVAKAGSTTFSNGVYAVTASGADIWNGADEFRFTYQALARIPDCRHRPRRERAERARVDEGGPDDPRRAGRLCASRLDLRHARQRHRVPAAADPGGTSTTIHPDRC